MYNQYFRMTNAELFNIFNTSKVYDSKMCEEICRRVGMYEDYFYADDGNIDRVVEEAAEQLRVSC